MSVELDIKLKRVYEPKSPIDGRRILIDRLWPRGVTKKAAAIDSWCRDLAPSTELRKWFGHDVDRWSEFRRRYVAELKDDRDRDGRVGRRSGGSFRASARRNAAGFGVVRTNSSSSGVHGRAYLTFHAGLHLDHFRDKVARCVAQISVALRKS